MSFTYYAGDRIVAHSSDGYPTGMMSGAMLTFYDVAQTYILTGASESGVLAWITTSVAFNETFTGSSNISANTLIGIPNGRSYLTGGHNMAVFVNGTRQRRSENGHTNDYDEVNSTGIQLKYAIATGAFVTFSIVA